MVPYSLTRNLRYTVYVGIVFLAFFLRDLVALIPWMGRGWSQAFTTAGLVAVLVWLFEKALWRWPASVGFPLVPNFSGLWYGYIRRESLVDEPDRKTHKRIQHEEFIPVDLTIEQNFSEIGIWLRTGDKWRLNAYWLEARSESEATLAGIHLGGSDRPSLEYNFQLNELRGHNVLSLQRARDGATLLFGPYYSNAFRKGQIELRRVASRGSLIICCQIRALKGKHADTYLGAVMPEDTLVKYCRAFRRAVGRRAFEEMRAARLQRDGNDCHVTLVTPAEYETLSSDPDMQGKLLKLMGQALWVELTSVGKQRSADAEVYYVICLSEHAQTLRSALGLGKKDLHVTMGFKGRDIHEAPKGPGTAISRMAWYARVQRMSSGSQGRFNRNA